MTTKQAEAAYLSDHTQAHAGKELAVFNPNSTPIDDLPVIYGWNNGGSNSWFLHARLVAEDGTQLGSHLCSDEGYMRHDLGIIEGSRPDRHETFKEHYPDGYRMEFVSYKDAAEHAGLNAAMAKSDE